MTAIRIAVALTLLSAAGFSDGRSQLSGVETRALSIALQDFRDVEKPQQLLAYSALIETKGDHVFITFIPPKPIIRTEKAKPGFENIIIKSFGKYVYYVVSCKRWQIISKTKDRD